MISLFDCNKGSVYSYFAKGFTQFFSDKLASHISYTLRTLLTANVIKKTSNYCPNFRVFVLVASL